MRAAAGVVAVVLLASLAAEHHPAAPSDAAPAARSYRFENVTSEANITALDTRTWGAAFVDYDRNGWPDLLVGRHLRRPLFVTNSFGTFRRRRIEDLEHPPDRRDYYDRHGCAWGEANGDGAPDLFCASGAQKGEGTGPNQLLLQRKDGDLVDRAGAYGVRDVYGRGRSAHWLDYDRDGRLDLFVGNEIRAGHPNLMFHSDPPPFSRASAGVGESLATTSSSWADWNRDRRPDLLVTAHGTRGATAYRNVGDRYERASLGGISGIPWLHVAWGDFNADGRPDAAATSLGRLTVFRNDGAGLRPVYSRSLVQGRNAAWLDVENDGDLDLFVVQGASGGTNRADFLVLKEAGGFTARFGGSFRGPRRGNGDSVVTADYDRDGRVDVFVTNGYDLARGRFQLLRNTTAAANSIEVELRGGRWNPFGYGARVHVRTDRLSLRRQITDGAGFRGQSEVSPAHFGIRGAAAARVTVVWPGGRRDCVVAPAGEVTVVARGASPCPG